MLSKAKIKLIKSVKETVLRWFIILACSKLKATGAKHSSGDKESFK